MEYSYRRIYTVEDTSCMDVVQLAALAEPNRLRIVELLDAAPRAVGEIAKLLDLRQPQVTKHLQTLERAGLVTMHPLGRRRIYALRRERLRELGEWLAGFEAGRPSESVLEEYEAAVAAEEARAERDPSWKRGRVVRLRRALPAPAAAIWPYWTDADLIRRWWSPEHFTVAECEAEPIPGGLLRIVMAEGDGSRHAASGHYVALRPPRTLSFELAPLAPDGTPLFAALHRLRLAQNGERTTLSLRIDVRDVQPAAAPALAGLRIGWEQLLDNLDALVSGAGDDR
jgi:uncharacterized protein YndB with AHSA1/START domain/DNA-binding transcriptional ArsR family regulator